MKSYRSYTSHFLNLWLCRHKTAEQIPSVRPWANRWVTLVCSAPGTVSDPQWCVDWCHHCPRPNHGGQGPSCCAGSAPADHLDECQQGPSLAPKSHQSLKKVHVVQISDGRKKHQWRRSSLIEIHLGMAATDGPENWIVDSKKGPAGHLYVQNANPFPRIWSTTPKLGL